MAAAILISVPVTFAAATMPAMAQGNSDIAIGKEIASQLGIAITIPPNVPPASVYLGSYIVNAVAACNRCHSNNEWVLNHNPFMGPNGTTNTPGQPKMTNTSCYLNGGRRVGTTTVFSSNITPDASGKPAGLTLAQFVQVMRTGVSPNKPGHILQSMPWPYFQDMADNDLNAIYDYLSSIPSLLPGFLLGGPPGC
jgi:hypothetical protein